MALLSSPSDSKSPLHLSPQSSALSESQLEKYRKFSYETNTKLSRLSHEELMIPLVYWHRPPEHKITAMYVQKSMRSGDIIITGSENGEFIIWKPYNTVHHPPTLVHISDDHWIPIAMTFSTNTTPITSILGSFQHKEQAAFMACHSDGETVIFSVYGAGALKIGCGERPIIKQQISGIYGYKLSNESYQYCVGTNFDNHSLHLIDLHKGKQINAAHLNSHTLPMRIVDVTFFELQLSAHCAIIDERGKIATFIIGENNNIIQPQLNFESRLTEKPINIGITFDNQYLCAVSRTEFVLFANDPLRFIDLYTKESTVSWDGMYVLDKYLYGIVQSDSIHTSGNRHRNGTKKKSRNNNRTETVLISDKNNENDMIIRPFFVLLWSNGCEYLTVYLVSKNDALLTPIIHLLIPAQSHRQWNVVTMDNRHIYIGTTDCKIIKYCMDEIESECLKSIKAQKLCEIKGMYIGSINDAFGDIDTSEESEEKKTTDEECEISVSCMNITRLGCLLCLGYGNGEIYIYNISTGEPIMEIHTQLSRVNALLLLCFDPSFDGILFVGYNNGYIEALNCSTGELMLSKDCHSGKPVQNIVTFDQDYYVFSTGKDNAMCSFLVYSQLITMKSVSNLSNNENDRNNIRINWYRGHSDHICNIYRNEWCLISDLVCCELTNGETYVWCVSTSQLERKFLKDKALVFNLDRKLFYSHKRSELPHLTKHEREIYDIQPQTYHCNVLMLDIRVLGDIKYDTHKMSTNESLKYDSPQKSKDNKDNKDINKLSDLLSLLLDWGVKDAEYEPLFLQQFNCLISDISPCYGYCGDFESQTLLFPVSSQQGGRWRIQPKVTAVYMLAINTICMWLLQCAPTNKLPVCSRLVTFYHVMLPDKLNGFVEPSRNSMARYCLNSVSEIRAASRMLLHGIVQRMTDIMRLSLISKWKKRFCNSKRSSHKLLFHRKSRHSAHSGESHQSIDLMNSSSTSLLSLGGSNGGKIPLSVLLGAIVICIIHSLKRSSIEDIVCESVIQTLITVLMEKVHTNSDMIKISLSCDYLGKVIVSWFKYVDDVEHLLKTLLDLRNCDHLLLKKSASSALLQCGVAVPQSFIKTMGNEALIIYQNPNSSNHHSSSDAHNPTHNISEAQSIEDENVDTKRHEQALMCIINLVQKKPAVLLKHIPLLVSTIIRCLDPSAPRRRKALLSATTASLHVLVTKYPNVAFHQETQHFAIGTGPARDNCILIYDLRTTTRWKQLKGHRAAVTAIEFNHNGSYMVSYSAYERPPTVKCWDIRSGGFFNAHGSKCIKTCPMPPLDRLYPPIDHLQYTKLTWNNKVKGAVKLCRENQSVLFFTVLPK